MANQTDHRAGQVHGGNPQSLIDQIVRNRIYSNIYWKEKLAGVNAEDLVERAVELKYIGGTYGGNRKPCKFLCLVLKLLQIQPEKQIIYTFLDNSHYKYVRALGLFYLRLVGSSQEVYTACEKLLTDWRPLIVRNHDGSFSTMHVDEFADNLTRLEIYLDVVLPRMTKRDVLEDQGKIEPKTSVMQQALDDLEDEEQAQDEAIRSRSRSQEKKSKKEKKDKKEKKHRSKSREEDSEERKERKRERKLKKLLKKSKKENKAKEREKLNEEEIKKQDAASYWAKLRAEQGIGQAQ